MENSFDGGEKDFVQEPRSSAYVLTKNAFVSTYLVPKTAGISSPVIPVNSYHVGLYIHRK